MSKAKEPRKVRRIKVIPPKSPEHLTVLDLQPGETFRYKLFADLKNVYMLLEPQSATEARYVHLNTGRVYSVYTQSVNTAKAIELVDVTLEVSVAPDRSA